MLRKIINNVLMFFGYKISRKIQKKMLSKKFLENYNKSKNLSSFNLEFFLFLELSLDYLFKRNRIEGDIVECGVFKGANCRFICDYLKSINYENINIFLYDTFEGMPCASSNDINIFTKKNYNFYLKKMQKNNEVDNFYKYENIENVKKLLFQTNYNKNKIHFIKGLVEETIPKTIPNKISLLILDTDYYDSTKHELQHLYPLVEKGGIIIIDDYGTWSGVKKAVDEYFDNLNDFKSFIDHKTIFLIKS
tara:strand:+ start:189 stop:935 length:747 start_codon:yes stop_codon:yes gene_type:complete